jgi:hypothetical protein
MKLEDVVGRFDGFAFPDEEVSARPDKDCVLAARAAMTAAVRDDEFVVDCLGYELTQLARPHRRRQNLVPFFTIPDTGIRFAFGYWPPGSNAGAHEHTDWTITSVCRNQLMVQTFDRDESYRTQTLVPKNLFDAHAGEVGFIYEPCIHDPRNPTDKWSLSMHVSSPHDGQKPADEEHCLPILDEFAARRVSGYGAPYDKVIAIRYGQVKLRAIAQFLANVDGIPVGHLLARCAAQGSTVTRRFIARLGYDGDVPSAPVLVRSHDELVLDYRETGDSVALGVQTDRGWVEELSVSNVARQAIAFCAGVTRFDARNLPGHLDDEEREALVDALQETGLFTLADPE